MCVPLNGKDEYRTKLHHPITSEWSVAKILKYNSLTLYLNTGIYLSMCLTYIVAEVTNCKQANIDIREHEEIYSEPGGVMDYEEDRSRPKR